MLRCEREQGNWDHSLRKVAGRSFFEIADDGLIKVVVKGALDMQYLADYLAFVLEGKEEGRNLTRVRVLAIIEDRKEIPDGSVEISVTPECIW